MNIKMMKAGYGDCFLIEMKKNSGESFSIMVDSGTSISYQLGCSRIVNKFLEENVLDLIVITHSDDDHVKGFNQLFNELLNNADKRSKVKRVIYNSPNSISKYSNGVNEKIESTLGSDKSSNTSAAAADSIQQQLFNLDLLEENIVINDSTCDICDDGIKITFLSPTLDNLNAFYDKYLSDKQKKKLKGANTKGINSNNDYDISFDKLKSSQAKESLTQYNSSSIAFLVEEQITGDAILMLGDSEYETVKKALVNKGVSPLKITPLTYMKLSHHGSICDLTHEFVELFQCNHYLISTDGKCYGHPDKKTLARICKYNENAQFYFNYKERIDAIFSNEPDCKYRHRCKYVAEGSLHGSEYKKTDC